MSVTLDQMKNTGVHKGAVLLASLGTELAVKVLHHLEESRVEPLVRTMTELGYVPAGERDLILLEFQRRMSVEPGLYLKGNDYARSLLEQTVGAERAARVLGEPLPEGPNGSTLEALLEQTSPVAVVDAVIDEHPQLIALVISQLSAERAADALSALPADTRIDVVSRMTRIEAPTEMAKEQIRQLLLEKAGNRSGGALPSQEGPKRVAEILGKMRRATEDSVFADLTERAPEVAEKIGRHRFTFSDFLALDGKSLQRVLRDVDADTLRLAMKGLDVEQQQILFSNMSERGAARLREDLENTGPTRLREVEGAQQSMVARARSLADQGEIQLSMGTVEGEEEEALV